MIVYLDLAVFINFLVDFCLLLGTNRLSGFPMAPLRSACAAMVGGVYGGACVLNGFRFLCGFFWRFVFLLLISLMAFGFRYSSLKRSGIFLILSMSLAGIALLVGQGGFFRLVLCAILLLLLANMVFTETIGTRSFVPLQLSLGERSASVIALCDSGNTLRDPVSGEHVFVLDGNMASSLTGLSIDQLSNPLDTFSKRPIPGLRLIPFRSVGCQSGMLLAVRFDNVRIGTTVRSAMIAFSPNSMGRDYQALVPCDAY